MAEVRTAQTKQSKDQEDVQDFTEGQVKNGEENVQKEIDRTKRPEKRPEYLQGERRLENQQQPKEAAAAQLMACKHCKAYFEINFYSLVGDVCLYRDMPRFFAHLNQQCNRYRRKWWKVWRTRKGS